MKLLLALALLALPMAAQADHLDVIQMTLKDGCTPAQLSVIVKDFNETWGKDNGYRAEIAVPLQSQDLNSVFWLGHTATAAAFGAAWDAWRDAQADSSSTAAKLQARFDKCNTNEARRSYDVY